MNPQNLTDFIVRPYQTGDEKAINDRFNQIFGLQRDLTEWYWKFKPPNESKVLLAFDLKGKLISHFGVLKENFTYLGKNYQAGHSVDNYSSQIRSAIHKGVFYKLAKQFFNRYGNPDNFSIIYGFPGTRNLRLGIHKLNFGTPLPVGYWEKKPEKCSNLSLKLVEDAFRLKQHKIDRLWQRAVHRYPVSIVRDAFWIEKRYLSRPGQNYRFLKTSSWGAYSSICVYVIRQDVLEVVDLVWDGRSKKDLEKLDKLLGLAAEKSRAPKLAMWLSGDEEAQGILADLGWKNMKEPNHLHLVVLSFDPRIDKQIALQHFYLTKGCTDII